MRHAFLVFLMAAAAFGNNDTDGACILTDLPLTLRLKGVDQGTYRVQLRAEEVLLCDVTHTIDLQEEDPAIKRYENAKCEDVTPHLWAFYPCMSRLFPEVPSVPLTVCANIPRSVPPHIPLSGLSLRFTAVHSPSNGEPPTSLTRVFTGETLLTILSAPPRNHYLDLGNGLLYDEEKAYMTHLSESCTGQCCAIVHPLASS